MFYLEFENYINGSEIDLSLEPILYKNREMASKMASCMEYEEGIICNVKPLFVPFEKISLNEKDMESSVKINDLHILARDIYERALFMPILLGELPTP
jgi:hypothetical protein